MKLSSCFQGFSVPELAWILIGCGGMVAILFIKLKLSSCCQDFSLPRRALIVTIVSGGMKVFTTSSWRRQGCARWELRSGKLQCNAMQCLCPLHKFCETIECWPQLSRNNSSSEPIVHGFFKCNRSCLIVDYARLLPLHIFCKFHSIQRRLCRRLCFRSRRIGWTRLGIFTYSGVWTMFLKTSCLWNIDIIFPPPDSVRTDIANLLFASCYSNM